MIIGPDFDYINSKTFFGKGVASRIKWSKGLFKLRFMFPLNDNYFWSSINLYSLEANIEIIGQVLEEKLSHDITTGVELHSNRSFTKFKKHTPTYNMTHRFNEVSIEWNNKKMLWKLNDHLINDIDIKEFSGGNESIAQIFNNTFNLVMRLTLDKESYIDPNFNLSNIHKPYLYIDYIRVYKQKETTTTRKPTTTRKTTTIRKTTTTRKTTTNSFPNANKTAIDLHSNLGEKNANSFFNTNKTIPLLLVILVVFIL